MLDKQAALEKVLQPPAPTVWRVRIVAPGLAAPYESDWAEPTIMGAVGHALHEFSMRMNRNLNTGIAELHVVAVLPEAEIEGAPA